MSKPGKDHRSITIETMKAAATPEYKEKLKKTRDPQAGKCPKAELQDFLRAENAKARR